MKTQRTHMGVTKRKDRYGDTRRTGMMTKRRKGMMRDRRTRMMLGGQKSQEE